MSWEERYRFLQAKYEQMFQERRRLHPTTFTLDYWKDHFVTTTLTETLSLKGKVLDIGCGTGEIDIWLARRNDQIEIDAIDISPQAIAMARNYQGEEPLEIQKRIRFFEAAFEKLPYQTPVFDVCILSHVLEYIKNPAELFQHLKAVLKPEARLVIFVPRGHGHQDPHHCWNFEPEEWREFVNLYGEVEKIWLSADGEQVAMVVRLLHQPLIVGMLRVRNEGRYLSQALASASQLVDAFVVLDDGSTDNTPEICKNHPKIKKYYRQEEQRSNEVQDNNYLLKLALALNPDWIILLDSDEVIESGGAEYIRREIEICGPEIGIFSFDFCYLWNDEKHFRFDAPYAQMMRQQRMFRIRGSKVDSLRFEYTAHESGFHSTGLMQGLRGQVKYLPVKIKHYGYLLPEQRQKKYNFYQDKDPERARQGYYDHLVNEAGIILIPRRDRSEALRADSADLPMYYSYLRPEIFSRVPTTARKILELGCAAGRLGRAIKERQLCYLVGIELNPIAAQEALKFFDEVITGDMDTLEFPFPEGFFDCIICADILEHLKDPWQVLEKITRLLVPRGMIVCSIPNIRNIGILDNLVKGKWQYQDAGILDRTHLRFFTREEFATVLKNCSYEIEKTDFVKDSRFAHLVYPSGQETLDLNLDRWLIKHVTPREFEELTALQILFVGKKAITSLQEKPSRQCRTETNSRMASIVIPVYNQVEYTQQCLEAITQNTPDALYDAVIIDNASTDQTSELLQALEGEVQIIRNESNLGFVHACNQGAEVVGGKYLVFLNNDTVPLSGWLEEMIALAESDSRIGVVGAKLVYPNGQLQEAGGIIFSDGNGWNFGRYDNPQNEQYNKICEVDYCSGACLLVRRDLFNQVGGFDLQYAPAYYEDADLCFSIRQLGYKVMYCPSAVVIHAEGVTAGRDLTSGWKQYQIRNREKFVAKWQTELKAQPENPAVSIEIPTTADRRERCTASAASLVNTNSKRHPLNILMVDKFLPLYDKATGARRIFSIVKILRKAGHHITFIAQYGEYQDRYKDELEALGVQVYATDPEKLEQVGKQVCAERIDLQAILSERDYQLAWIAFYDVAEQYLPDIRRYSPRTKIIVDTVDIHFIRETREAELFQNESLRQAAQKTREQELAIYSQADMVIALTPTDEKIIKDLIPQVHSFIIPTIHEIKKPFPPFPAREGLLFIGNFNHSPNRDAVIYLCDEILPKIQAKIPDIKLYIVGPNPPETIKLRTSKNLIITDYVPEIETYIHTSRISLAPLRYGSGMKGKIAEALGLGLPVITSSTGSEGMGLIPDEHVLIADDAESFAQAVVRLYQSPELWKQLSEQGQHFISQNYSFAVVAQKLDILLDLLSLLPKDQDHPRVDVKDNPLPSKKLVSLVILTHNQQVYTQQCLQSIFACTQEPYELIFVDNHSTDGTVAYLEGEKKTWHQDEKKAKYCKDFKIIKNQQNLGYAAGNNQGIAVAQGEYILLLNNDIVVTPGWLGRMLACAERKPQIGIVGPMSNHVSGPQRVSSVTYDTLTLTGLNAFAQDFARQHAGQARPFWRVVGFCMLIKRAVIEKIGGLDVRFGRGNFEDDDFSLRATLAGFESWLAQDCFVHHFGSRTFAGEKVDYAESLHQNWEIFKSKWGIPKEIAYGAVYNLRSILETDFKTQEHYCAYK